MLQFIQMNVLDVGECINMYLDLHRIVAPSMANWLEELFANLGDDECIDFISNAVANEKSIYLVIEPMSENMTIDKVRQLYEMFPWAKPESVLMPIVDSSGEVRYIPSRRPIVYGYQYIYRLKQYAEEKFSVTSLSATNIRNENSKSKNSNNYKALYSRTPIRFGDMETGNLIHLGAELVVQMLMLYSTSPHARRLTSEMLTGDPFNIDVNLDMESTNRNVEILNVYLKTMGLRLSFTRKPKEIIRPILFEPIKFIDRSRNKEELIQPIIFRSRDVKIDVQKEAERLKRSELIQPIIIEPIEYYYREEDKNE